jgi:L-ascorbate metabolism protein UlaG (beta-lactamase superfamily)
VIETPLPQPLSQLLAGPPGKNHLVIWLGQAGFVLDGGMRRVVIDPYLSDSLAQKYAGTAFPHDRMMPVPIAPGDIEHVDLVLTTHAHTDHMDPGTLAALMSANPGAILIAPKAARDAALARSGVDETRLQLMDAGETRAVLPDLLITATAAAHESLELDDAGHHRFLGYAVTVAGRCIFHSGDTIPFDGQAAEVAALHADLALFPVNGRDAVRAANGIPGNLTADEAVQLAKDAAIPVMIAHHYGLFAFNTASPDDLARIRDTTQIAQALIASIGICWMWP